MVLLGSTCIFGLFGLALLLLVYNLSSFMSDQVEDQMKLLHNSWSEILILDFIYRQIHNIWGKDIISVSQGYTVTQSSTLISCCQGYTATQSSTPISCCQGYTATQSSTLISCCQGYTATFTPTLFRPAIHSDFI